MDPRVEREVINNIVNICAASLHEAHQSWFFLIPFNMMRVPPQSWNHVKHVVYQRRPTFFLGLVTFHNKVQLKTLRKRFPEVTVWVNRACPHSVATDFVVNGMFETIEHGTMCPRLRRNVLKRAGAFHESIPRPAYSPLHCFEEIIEELESSPESSYETTDSDSDKENYDPSFPQTPPVEEVPSPVDVPICTTCFNFCFDCSCLFPLEDEITPYSFIDPCYLFNPSP